MYLRVIRGRYESARDGRDLRLVEGAFLPTLRQVPGFRGVHTGIDSESGELVAVSLWDTREQAQVAGDDRSSLGALDVELEAAELYEVATHA
jgi:hypothetical protein